MDSTTLPTLLLGGDPDGSPEETYASWRAALALPSVRGLVVGRTLLYPPDDDVAPPWTPPRRWSAEPDRVDAPLPRGLRHAGCRLHAPAAHARPRRRTTSWSRPSRPAGATRACGCSTLAAGGHADPRHRGRRDHRACRCPVRPSVERRRRDVRARPAGRDVFTGPTDTAYLPIAQHRGPASQRRRADRAAGRARRPARCRSGTGRPRRSTVALRGTGQCTRQVNNFGRRRHHRGRHDDRQRGDHAGRQLVVLPAAQARRARPTAETELEEIYYYLFARRPGRRRRASGYQRVYGTPERPIDVLRRGPRPRHRPRPARLARPVDRRARATTCTT